MVLFFHVSITSESILVERCSGSKIAFRTHCVQTAFSCVNSFFDVNVDLIIRATYVSDVGSFGLDGLYKSSYTALTFSLSFHSLICSLLKWSSNGLIRFIPNTD